jgi:SecDF, P1 head subdomain
VDDRELETRLRDRLHRRFDDATPTPELADSVAEVFGARPQRVGWNGLGAGRLQFASSLAAVAALAVLAVVVAKVWNPAPLGPGGEHPTPTPVATPSTERLFVVLSRSVGQPSKDDAGLTTDRLAARLSALGISNFTAATGFGIVYELSLSGPSDVAIRDVLEAPGEVEFVPLSPEVYGEGGFVAEPGKPLPKEEAPLFGWEGIASAARTTDQQGRPSTTVTFTPAAAALFGEYTSKHINEQLAIVIDGVVALMPYIQGPITSGQVELSAGGEDDALFQRTTAILVGGRLPESWRDHGVPAILSEDAAVAAAIRVPGATVAGARDLDVIQDGARWRAVWVVSIVGEFPGECPLTPSGQPTDCPIATEMQVTLDAETGAFISGEAH